MTLASSVDLHLGFRARVEAVGFSGADILALHGLRAHRGGPGHLLIHCPNPQHIDSHPSCSVDVATGRARCFGCGFRAGDVVALHAVLGGFASMGDALRHLERRAGQPALHVHLVPAPARQCESRRSNRGEPVVVRKWTYRLADGTPAFEVHRLQFRLPDGSWFIDDLKDKPAKVYLPAHPGGSPRKMPAPYATGALRPLFNLPTIVAAEPGTTIYVVEGEPCVDALASVGLLSTTSSGGASNPHRTDWSPLAARRLVVWSDNDAAGVQYADNVINLVSTLTPAPALRRVDVAKLGLPVGGDAVDWLERGRRKVL